MSPGYRGAVRASVVSRAGAGGTGGGRGEVQGHVVEITSLLTTKALGTSYNYIYCTSMKQYIRGSVCSLYVLLCMFIGL